MDIPVVNYVNLNEVDIDLFIFSFLWTNAHKKE